jgi:hypothetical protein
MVPNKKHKKHKKHKKNGPLLPNSVRDLWKENYVPNGPVGWAVSLAGLAVIGYGGWWVYKKAKEKAAAAEQAVKAAAASVEAQQAAMRHDIPAVTPPTVLQKPPPGQAPHISLPKAAAEAAPSVQPQMLLMPGLSVQPATPAVTYMRGLTMTPVMPPMPPKDSSGYQPCPAGWAYDAYSKCVPNPCKPGEVYAGGVCYPPTPKPLSVSQIPVQGYDGLSGQYDNFSDYMGPQNGIF